MACLALMPARRSAEPTDRHEFWVGQTAALEPQPEASAVERAIGGLMDGFLERQR